MLNFLLGLFWNLAILAAVSCVCCAINGLAADTAIDGCVVFAMMAAFALAFDAALTFLIFADSQKHYGQFSTSGAFAERAFAYIIAGAVALCIARLRAVRRRASTQDVNRIGAAQYRRSRLPY